MTFLRLAPAALFFLRHLSSAAAAAACPDAAFSSSDGWHCVEITTSLTMSYMVDGNNDVNLGVHAKGHTGWVGIGVNGNGGMKGASMVVVRKVDGEWVAEDRHAVAYAKPLMDDQQDATLVSAEETNGDIIFRVTMPKTSCDPDDYPFKDMLQTVLWAMGSSHDFAYHGLRADVDRGALEVNFFQAPVTPEDPSDAVTIEVKMPNVPIKGGPNGQDPTNPYVCAVVDLSALNLPSDKMHVTKYEPLIAAGNHPYVHHMIMNPCREGKPSYAQGNDPSMWYRLDCEAMVECTGANFVWAVGAGTVVFPSEAGFPVEKGVKYAAIQMHYYNPEEVQGLTDSSGFRLTLTPTLRKYDVGVMQVNGGTRPSMAHPLPPGRPQVWKHLQIPSQCFDDSFPDGQDEVMLLKVFHHLHEVGTQMHISLIRDGVYMGPLRNEKMYDFKHQSFADSEFDTLKRTDQLLVGCSYDTSGRTAPVSFGDLTQQEMCFGGVYYYPAVEDIDANVVLQQPAVATDPAGCVAFQGCNNWDEHLASQRHLDYICKLGIEADGMTACEYMIHHDIYGFLRHRGSQLTGKGGVLAYCQSMPALESQWACSIHEGCEGVPHRYFRICEDGLVPTCTDRNVSLCNSTDADEWAKSFCTDYCGGTSSMFPISTATSTDVVSYHMQEVCLEESTETAGVSKAVEMIKNNPLLLYIMSEGNQDERHRQVYSGPQMPSLERLCNEHDFGPSDLGLSYEAVVEWINLCPKHCTPTRTCTTEDLDYHAQVAAGRLCTSMTLNGFPSVYPHLKKPASGFASPPEPHCREITMSLRWQESTTRKRGMKTSTCDIGNAHLCKDGVQGCISTFKSNVLCPRFGKCDGSYPMSTVCTEGWTSENGKLDHAKLMELKACFEGPNDEYSNEEKWVRMQCERECNRVEQDGKHVTECGDDLMVVSQNFTYAPPPTCVPEGGGSTTSSWAHHGSDMSAVQILSLFFAAKVVLAACAA